MRAGSFDLPPIDGEAIHQLVDDLLSVMGRVRCEVGIFGGGQNGAVAEDFLHLEQIDACFDQVRGVGVAKTVRSDLFFIPQA